MAAVIKTKMPTFPYMDCTLTLLLITYYTLLDGPLLSFMKALADKDQKWKITGGNCWLFGFMDP